MGNPVRPLQPPPEPVVVKEPGPEPLPAGELPAGAPRAELPAERQQTLNQAAEKVGNAIGTAVERARELPRKVVEIRERLNVTRTRTREDVATAASDIKENAHQRVLQLRTRTRLWVQENPLQTIALGAAGAFVLGFVLRIWRSHARRY